MGGQVEPRGGFGTRVTKKFSNLFHGRSPKKGTEDSRLSVLTGNLSNDSSLNSLTSESPGEFYRGGYEKGSPALSSLVTQDSVEGQLGSGKLDHAASPWPEEFICPISKVLMADPVIVESGVTYERQNVLAYLNTGNTNCFKSGDRLEHLGLTKNSALKKAIDNWCVSHQVPRPVAPDAETAKRTVDRVCRLGSTAVPTAVSEIYVTSDTASSSDFSGGSLGVESWKGSPATTPEMLMTRPSGNDWRPEQIPEASPVNTSSKDPSHSDELRSFGDKSWHNHSWNGGKRQPFPKELNNGTADAQDEEKFWSAASSGFGHGHSSSVVNSPTAPSFSVGPHQVPLTLSTLPVAFSMQEIGSGPLPSNVGDLNEAVVKELIQKLQHRQPLEQEQAVIEIRRLTRVSAENRMTLCQPEFLDILLPLAQSRYSNVQINAVAAVMNMSLEKENKLKVARAGAIPCLIDVLKSGHFEAQEHAAGAIFSLALNDENKMAIGVLGAIPPLIHVLRSGKHGARRDAAMALYHLSISQMNRNKLIKAGGVGILLNIAKDEKNDVVSRALLILCNIAATQEGRVALAEMNAVQVLVGLLTGDASTSARTTSAKGQEDSQVNVAEVREHAAASLLQLSHHNFRFKSQALQAGALDGLQRLAVEGTPRAQEKAAALLAILRDAPSTDNSVDDTGSLYRRSYVRNARAGVDDKVESAQF